MRSFIVAIVSLSLLAGSAAPGLSFPLSAKVATENMQASPIVDASTKKKVKKRTKAKYKFKKRSTSKHKYKHKSKYKSKHKTRSKSRYSKIASKKRKRSNLPPALAQIRKRLVRHKKVSDKELTALAQYGDSLGAVMLADRIVAGGKPDRLPDAVYYYAVAASKGRTYTVRPMVRLLSREDLTYNPSQVAQAEKTLVTLAKGKDNFALRSILEFYLKGKPFGAKHDDAIKLLEGAKTADDGQLALSAAMQLLAKGSSDPGRRSAAIRYLKIAAASPDLGRQIAAANLLNQIHTPDAIGKTEAQ